MAIDLTGGLDVSRENVFARRPDNPEMRDSVSMWISDDRGELGLPRIGIEAVASDWETHLLQLNVGFPDGRSTRPPHPRLTDRRSAQDTSRHNEYPRILSVSPSSNCGLRLNFLGNG
jgi:hypothetical protein